MILVAQMVKNLPAMQDTRVQSLSQEDPLEKGMVTHSSILAWRILWTEKPGGYCPWDFLDKNTGVGDHALLQEIFPTQGLNPGLLHCRRFFII